VLLIKGLVRLEGNFFKMQERPETRFGRDDKDRGEATPSGEQMSPEEMEGVYIISVAARILEMHPQTLRKYERAGLVSPSRTVGMLRLYSDVDIARLRLIKHLVNELGLNLAGVQMVLDVFNHLVRLQEVVPSVDDKRLRPFISQGLAELFELLHAHRVGRPERE